MLERLTTLPTSVLLALLGCLVCGAAGAGVGYGFGFRQADALGAARLKGLRATHAEQALAAEQQARVALQQQVTRANEAERLLLADQAAHTQQVAALEGRIAHVTAQYRRALDQAPEPAPHCVFTVGWLRDYNTALGVPGAATGPVAGRHGTAPFAAAGADAELLESGVTPADILAHAQDYGRWARGLASQVVALQTLRKDATP